MATLNAATRGGSLRVGAGGVVPPPAGGVVCAAGAAQGPKGKAKSPLEGTYTIVRGEHEGKPELPARIKGHTVRFSADTVIVADVYSATASAGTQTVAWNAAAVKDGTYAAVLTTTDQFATVTRSALFKVDKTPPRLRALSFRALRFWVSEPAKVRLVVNGHALVANVLAGDFSFRHGRVREVRISAQDGAGNVSRTLRFP